MLKTREVHVEKYKNNVSELLNDPTELQIGEDAARLHVLDLLLVLGSNMRFLLMFVGASALLSLIIAFLIPTRYQATMKLIPPMNSQTGASALLGQLGPLAGLAQSQLPGLSLNAKNPSDICVALLQSRTAREAIVRRFDLMNVYGTRYMEDALKKLGKNTDVDQLKQGVITVSVEDRDPQRAAKMADAYAEEVQKIAEGLAITEASQRRAVFDRQLVKSREELASAEFELRKIQEKTGILELGSQARAVIESLVELRAEISAREVALESMRAFATSQNPDVILAQRQLAALRAKLAELEKGAAMGEGNIQIPTGRFPELGLEYLRRFREVKYREAVFELMARQFEMAKLDEARNALVIEVLDKASIPEKRSWPKRWMIISGGTLLGLMFGIVIIFVREAYRALKADPEAAAKIGLLRQHLQALRVGRSGSSGI
jgi:tyrosine-protein kinase Etk/Wzc